MAYATDGTDRLPVTVSLGLLTQSLQSFPVFAYCQPVIASRACIVLAWDVRTALVVFPHAQAAVAFGCRYVTILCFGGPKNYFLDFTKFSI